MTENPWGPIKLTRRAIKALPRPPKGKKPFVRDTDIRHLGVRLIPDGLDVYALKYRPKSGPKIGTERYYTIGAVNDWSDAAIKSEVRRLNRLIDQGLDPASEREHDRRAPDVSALCDRFLEEHVARKKPSTRRGYKRMVEKLVLPMLGHLKVEAVEHEDIERFHRGLRRTPRQANHAVAMVSKMMSLAERWKLRPPNSNPCRHIERYPENARDRYPLPDELERIGAAMREMEAEGVLRPEDVACIRFLALVGCRLSEAVELDLAHVDFRTGAWALPDAKTGARTMILGAPALALLASLGRTTGRAFVRKDGRPVTVNMIERAWIGQKAQPKHGKPARPGIRDRADVPDLRIHDLRHGVGTYAGAAGLNAFMVRDLLGHRTMAMTGRYVSKHVDPLRAAADAISGQIAAAMERPPAELIELPKSGRR